MNATFFSNVDPIFAAAQRIEPGLGADEEQVQRAVIRQIFKNVEDAIKYQEGVWAARDLAFAEEMDRAFTPIQITRPKADAFRAGGRPSLVEAPIEFWPSITARCNSGRAASPNEQIDQFDVMLVDLFIEVMCVSGAVNQTELHQQAGVDADGMVDAQVQRLSSAVQGCISLDKTLGGVVPSIDKPATVKSSVPFARPGVGPGGAGPYYVFQGKQLQYTIIKHLL